MAKDATCIDGLGVPEHRSAWSGKNPTHQPPTTDLRTVHRLRIAGLCMLGYAVVLLTNVMMHYVLPPVGHTTPVNISNTATSTATFLTASQASNSTEVPLGTIVAWVPSPNPNWIPQVPVPKGWHVCNGSIILDSSSPWIGQYAPNLTDRFLRGGDMSNFLIPQEDQIQDHEHIDGGHSHVDLGHTHNDSGHTHIDLGHTHTDLGHSHIDPGHTHSDLGHTHIDAGHTHSDLGHTHTDLGHAHDDFGHAHIDEGHSHTDAGHTHTDLGHTHTDTGHTHTDGGHTHTVANLKLNGVDEVEYGKEHNRIITTTTTTSTGYASIQSATAKITEGFANLGPATSVLSEGNANITTSHANISNSSANLTVDSASLSTDSAFIQTSFANLSTSSAVLTNASAAITTDNAVLDVSHAMVTSGQANVANATSNLQGANPGPLGARVGDETRPKAMYVIYIIKVADYS